MIQLQFQVTVDKFDRNKYLKRVDEVIREDFIKAGRLFLLAAVPRIPFLSGMARGAFYNAEDVFGKAGIRRDGEYRIYGTKGGNRVDKEYSKGYTYEGSPRFPQRGRDYSTLPNDILPPSVSIARGKSRYTMSYDISIKYFNALDTTKWGGMQAGIDAAVQYLQGRFNMPDPTSKEFMTQRSFLIG